MSFIHAFSGIYNAVKKEAHLRFHIVIGNLICIFAYFYGIDRTQWAVLLLTIFAVMSAELLNTAIEKAVDTATYEIRPTAKLSKDAAAGGVLVLAVCAILVGVCLFGDMMRILDTLTRIFTNPEILIPCLIIGVLDLLFLFFFKEKKVKF